MNSRFLITALALTVGANAFSANGGSCISASDSISLDEVVVTGTRSATTMRNIPSTVSVVGSDVLAAGGRDNVLPALTERVPGMFTTQRAMMGYGVSGNAAGGISIRGMQAGSGQVLVLIDGHPQYQGIFGHSISDSYQTMMAGRVEVVRGPASVLYGSNAMGGVVNIITSDDAQKGDYCRSHLNLGAGSYGTIQAEAGTKLRTGRFSVNASAQYGRSDNHRPRMGFEQYGGFLRMGYDLSVHWKAFADIDLTHFNASNPGSLDKPLVEADQWITRGMASLGADYRYSWLDGRISLYDNFGIHKVNDGYSPGASPKTELFRSKDALAGISWYQTMRLFRGNSFTLGFDYQHIYGRAWYTSRSTGETVTTGQRGKQSTHRHNNELAAYADMRHEITSWLTLDAGIRWDHHSVAGTEWIPQAGLVVRPLRDAAVKATVSKGFRNPSTKDLFLYGSANADLQPERMWNYEISWSHALRSIGVSYGVSLFIMDVDNLIQTVAVGGAQKNVNTGGFRNSGIELEATWKVSSVLTLTTNHSYLNIDKPIIGAPEYKGFLGADLHLGRLTAGLTLQQLSGLYISDTEKENYTLLGANVSYRATDFLRVWARGENLLCQSYEVMKGFPMPRATFMAGVSLTF